jgi:DUF177 domain-containing protein
MGARGAFVVPIHDLDVEGREVSFPITAAWLRGALEACEMQPAGPEGRLEAHLTKTGNEVLVQAQVDVVLTIACARCLQPVQLRPAIELALLLYPASSVASPRRRPSRAAEPPSAHRPAASRAAEPGDGDISGEEADLDTYEGDEVVLDRFVREAVLLESPIFPLCSEACEGIRPASESASPSEKAVTDPRLLPLLELAKRRQMKE